MKKIIVVLALLFSITTQAQPPRRDTIWGNFPNQEYYNHILRATVVSGETQQIIIHPNQEPFCFDKKITIKSTVSSRAIEQCLYLDTKGGLIAYLKPSRNGGSSLCDIKPDDKDFFFSVMGLKGNVYNYSNTEKKGVIQHWVSTGNTQEHVYMYDGATNTNQYTLHKKGERRDYCDGKIKATSYKYDGATAPTMFLFGKTYPPDINVTANKYIGNFGIGYQYTDKGLYIIMENVATGYTCKITSIEDVNVCFNPAPFQKQEDEFRSKRNDELQKEREKLDKQERDAGNSRTCSSEKLAVVNFKKEQLRKQEENLRNSNHGNVYQDNVTQQAYMGMMDPLISVQGGILSARVSICGIEADIAKHPNDNSLQGRLNCKQNMLAKLMSAEAEMKALDTQYANSPGKAMAEKSKVYLRAMSSSCD